MIINTDRINLNTKFSIDEEETKVLTNLKKDWNQRNNLIGYGRKFRSKEDGYANYLEALLKISIEHSVGLERNANATKSSRSNVVLTPANRLKELIIKNLMESLELEDYEVALKIDLFEQILNREYIEDEEEKIVLEYSPYIRKAIRNLQKLQS